MPNSENGSLEDHGRSRCNKASDTLLADHFSQHSSPVVKFPNPALRSLVLL